MKNERFRDNNTLAAEVANYDLAKPEGLGALEMRIRTAWSVAEVAKFQHSLHGGHFISKAGWYRMGMSGIVTATDGEDEALQRLWDRLLADCWRMVGAASALHVEGAKPFKWVPAMKTAKHKNAAIVTNDVDIFGREDALIYKTYAELAQLVGNQLARQASRQASKK